EQAFIRPSRSFGRPRPVLDARSLRVTAVESGRLNVEFAGESHDAYVEAPSHIIVSDSSTHTGAEKHRHDNVHLFPLLLSYQVIKFCSPPLSHVGRDGKEFRAR